MNKKLEDKYVMAISILFQFAANFIALMISVALPTIGTDLNLSFEVLNLISVVFMIAMVSVSIPLSRFISRMGINKYLKINSVLMIVALFMSGMAYDPYVFIISRILQGIAYAGLVVTIHVMIVKQISEDKIGSALGYVGSSGYIGMTSAPALSGFIVSFLSWRYLFFITTIIFVVGLILLFRLDKEWDVDDAEFDYSGALVYFFMSCLFAVGILSLNDWGIYAIIISLILTVIFYRIESKKDNPIYRIGLLKNFKYLVGNLVGTGGNFMLYIATYVLNFFLQYVLKIEPHIAGTLLLITPVVMIFVSPVAGKLSDNHDSSMIVIISLFILLAVTILIYFVNFLPFYVLILILVIQGLGNGIFSAPNNKIVLTAVEDKDVSDASAMLTTSKDFGKMCGLGLYTFISSVLVTGADIYSDIPGLLLSMEYIMIISAVFIVISIILMGISMRKDRKALS